MVTFAVVGFLGYIAITKAVENIAAQNATKQNRPIVAMVDAFRISLEEHANTLGKVFAKEFHGAITLDTSTRTTTGQHSSYVLATDGVAINNNLAFVDRFTEMTGATATVFIREGDDFLRVTTSLKKESGERAMGTFLGTGHPGYQILLSGQHYLGKAKLFGRDYMARYDPIKDCQRQCHRYSVYRSRLY